MISYSRLHYHHGGISATDVVELSLLKTMLAQQSHKPRTVMLSMSTVRKAAAQSFVFVARSMLDGEESRGQIVGTVTLCVKHTLDGARGETEDVVVHDGYRRRGIGRRLMELLHETARRQGAFRIKLTSNADRADAHSLYLAMGYQPYDTNVFAIDLSTAA